MSRRANPTLIGAFVFGALVLATLAVLLLAGGRWFRERQHYTIYFEEGDQGLQVGAPVVFLGVKVGMVKEIRLGYDEKTLRFLVPVTIELEPDIFHSLADGHIEPRGQLSMRRLVERGLRAQMKVQSFLTGQLYVHLDFYPEKEAHFVGDAATGEEIPTIPTTVEELTTMLEGFPVREFLSDLAGITASVNQLLSLPELRDIPVRLDATLLNLETLTGRIETASGPFWDEAAGNLVELRKTLDAVDAAMVKVGKAADRVGALADVDSRPYVEISQLSTGLTTASEALRRLVDEESPTVRHLNRSLVEISRAARALRLLAESLERQPEAVLRGKGDEGER